MKGDKKMDYVYEDKIIEIENKNENDIERLKSYEEAL